MEHKDRCVYEDGHWFSPDNGRFWAKGDKLYWETGEVTENVGVMRLMKMEGPDYSQWPDEYRAEVLKENQRRYGAYQKQKAEEKAAHDKLVDAARAKLTQQEFNAVLLEGSGY